MKTVRIFVSSPGDVGAEREKAREIFDRLQTEFSGLIVIEPYFWEHEPMSAHTDFQAQIEPPSKFDLFVGLLWARLGSCLHPGLHQKPGGGDYASGTEYELLDAMEGFRRSKVAEVLIYKRQGDPLIPAKPKEERERILSQYDALDAFFTRLTQDDGYFVAGTNSYGWSNSRRSSRATSRSFGALCARGKRWDARGAENLDARQSVPRSQAFRF